MFSMPGPMELIVILVIVLLFFGAGRLPNVMGDVAKGIKAFKKGLKDEDDNRPTKGGDDAGKA